MIGIEEGGPVTCIRFAGGMTGGTDEQQGGGDEQQGGGRAMSEKRCGAASERSAGHRQPVVKKTAQDTLYMLRLQRSEEAHKNSLRGDD